MIKFTGDFRSLQAFAKRLEKAPALVSVITRNMAEETIALIGGGFERQSDPYGSKWKPKLRDDGRSILVGKTARLRNGWHVVTADSSGFRVAPSVQYARFHQRGTRRMVSRKMIPDKGRLPPLWRRHLVLTAREVLTDHFG